MSIIADYVYWIGHDAAGTLPPLDVVAGIIRPGAWRMPEWWPPLGPDEAVVFVPAQWVGDWESGYALAPAYQYLWPAPRTALRPLPSSPLGAPYRPQSLPASASGPRSPAKARRRS